MRAMLTVYTKKITRSAKFLDLPLSAQALYFHLVMEADRMGYIDNPQVTAAIVNADKHDLNLLIVGGFVERQQGGVCVQLHEQKNGGVHG